uniref:Uncharacterized protein n=1 Tax=Steinernema glaseri TaxID=37863 RepID=A0A1I7Y3S3_9BILA
MSTDELIDKWRLVVSSEDRVCTADESSALPLPQNITSRFAYDYTTTVNDIISDGVARVCITFFQRHQAVPNWTRRHINAPLSGMELTETQHCRGRMAHSATL